MTPPAAPGASPLDSAALEKAYLIGALPQPPDLPAIATARWAATFGATRARVSR